jgi:predicted  nucleic acid-binding Zn-ribbon protein
MHDQIQARIEALRKELELGQQRMHDLEQQLTQLRDTMLRISGAIQVLEELQAQATSADAAPDAGSGAEEKG